MKDLQERIWSSDHEIVYESRKPYELLFAELARMAAPAVILCNYRENWTREEDDHIQIEIFYDLNGETQLMSLPRRNDFLDMGVLLALNILIQPCDYHFEYAPDEESICFINDHEKKELESKGWKFKELSFGY